MPTIEDAKSYCGIDVLDEMQQKNLQRALDTAEQIVLGAVGKDVETYLPGDARTAELILMYTDDLYSERGVSAKVSGATRRLAADMEQQLRLELRRAKEEAGAE